MKCMKIILSGLVALAATANAMPTQEETKRVEPLVMDLMRDDQAVLKSGKKTRAEVAESAMALADQAESEAAKFLLMKGAFSLYVRAGEFDKAMETLQNLQTAIPDMPPDNLAKIIETSLRVVPRKNGGQLYRLLGEIKARSRYTDELKTLENSVKKTPADRSLRLKLAEHYAFLGDWNLALENFAAVDGKIGEIAKAERNGEGATKKVADFWWDYPTNHAKDKSDELERCFHAHAAKLYEEAIASDDIKGLNKVQAERRIEEAKEYGENVFSTSSARTNDSKDVPNVEYKFSYRLENGMAIITGVDPKLVGTVIIPDKIDGHLVTGIEGYNDRSAFWGCDQLKRIVFPAGLEDPSPGAFMSCKSLSSIEISRANKKFTSRDGVLYSKDFSTLFIYPKTRESVKLSPKTRKVYVCAFRGCAALKTAKIPEGVEEVGPWNLCGCSDLEWIEFPKSLRYLGPCAAHGNDKLKKIVFNGDAPQAGLSQFTWGQQFVFTGAPEDLVVEVRKGTKGWKSPGSTELPECWPTNQDESRPIRYIGDTSPSMAGKGGKDLYMIVDLTKTGKAAVSYLGDVPKNGWGDEYKTKKMVLRRIEPGSFEYLPGKSFKITKPFYIGVFEVTQKQYEMTMKTNPSAFKGDMRPVETVSYLDIRGSNKGLNWPKDNKVDNDSYLGKLRKRIGLEFDLPTEVQWEYACRAGTKGDFNVEGVDVNKLGKFRDCGGLAEHHVEVGSFLPNAWGLYNMHCNVWEWCVDRSTEARAGYFQFFGWDSEPKETESDPKGMAFGTSRVLRGGSWCHPPSQCHSSFRARVDPHVGGDGQGFRLACPAE